MLHVTGIPAFSDNYLWLLHDGRQALVIDPGDAEAVQGTLARLGLSLAAIAITHHHADHTGGLARLQHRYGCPVYAPVDERIAPVTHPVTEGSRITLAAPALSLRTLAVPGHTRTHVAYLLETDPPRLFCGDTLFTGGCGRLFEGSASEMRASLARLAALPDATQVHCAHEYTLANLRFARQIEPGNAALERRYQAALKTRNEGQPTVPGTIAQERETNPFLRWHSAEIRAAAGRFLGREARDDDEVFAAIRELKNRS